MDALHLPSIGVTVETLSDDWLVRHRHLDKHGLSRTQSMFDLDEAKLKRARKQTRRDKARSRPALPKLVPAILRSESQVRATFVVCRALTG
jgi:hypothetical protein